MSKPEWDEFFGEFFSEGDHEKAKDPRYLRADGYYQAALSGLMALPGGPSGEGLLPEEAAGAAKEAAEDMMDSLGVWYPGKGAGDE